MVSFLIVLKHARPEEDRFMLKPARLSPRGLCRIPVLATRTPGKRLNDEAQLAPNRSIPERGLPVQSYCIRSPPGASHYFLADSSTETDDETAVRAGSTLGVLA
jgi:hypothetical protein